MIIFQRRNGEHEEPERRWKERESDEKEEGKEEGDGESGFDTA